MSNQNPEQKARDLIDLMLDKAGWVVQNKDPLRFVYKNTGAITRFTDCSNLLTGKYFTEITANYRLLKDLVNAKQHEQISAKE